MRRITSGLDNGLRTPFRMDQFGVPEIIVPAGYNQVRTRHRVAQADVISIVLVGDAAQGRGCGAVAGR